MQPRILEGSWDEVASHSKELAGHRVRASIVDDDSDGEAGSALKRAMDEILNRTPEERAEISARVLATVRPGRELPPGKTLWDVIVSKWPGDETDEQIYAALKELS